MSKLKWTVCVAKSEARFPYLGRKDKEEIHLISLVKQIEKLFTFFWMDEYLMMSDLKESRDLFCLSPDFNKLFQENEQLGKNVFMLNCFLAEVSISISVLIGE